MARQLGLLRNLLSRPSVNFCRDPTHTLLPSILSSNARSFSTVPQDTVGDSSSSTPIDPFLKHQSHVIGRLTGIGRNMLKTDVVHYFEDCNLTPQHIKVDYNPGYSPFAMILQFGSQSDFGSAVRTITRKGRLYKLDQVPHDVWDRLKSHDGRSVIFQGFPLNAVQEDIERYLSGFSYNASNMNISLRGRPPTMKAVIVGFQTSIEAMNACNVKNRGFCLNSPITARVLF
ncbi:hypothetical protein QJS04_geneDACA010520 [Acorus gramineus]|uniref:Uncharacterized protein n=1 Tax=Acorus gramineus TaxID=55184 RepID=A0AAV9AKZ6_ACOGR|nr:hypothetical protein QJS04_geneDACA010520 [Acorus gramineus]